MLRNALYHGWYIVKNLICISLLSLSAVILPVAANADGIQGTMWSVPAATADNVPTQGTRPLSDW